MNIESVNVKFNIGDYDISRYLASGISSSCYISNMAINDNKKRNDQLNNIEDKIDALTKKVNKQND